MKKAGNTVFEYTCYMLMLMIGLQLAGYQYSLIYITKEFTLTNTQMGLLTSMQFVPTLLMPLLFGGLLDKYNKRVISPICAVVYCLGSVCVLLSESIVMLAIGIFVLASGGAIAPSALPTLLTELDPQNSNRYANMAEVFYSLGNVISPIMMAWAIGQGMHWRGLYALVMICSLMIGVAMLLMRPQAKGSVIRIEEEEGGRFRLDLVALMLVAFGMLYNFIEPGFMTFASTYFTEVIYDPVGASLSISVMGLTMVASRMVASRFKGVKEKLMFTGLMGAIAAGLLMAFVPIKGVSVVWCAIFGILAGPCWPMMMSVAIDCFPRNAGRVTSLIMAGSGIGGILVTPLMGMVSDAIGIAPAYLVSVAAAVLAAVAISIVYRYRKKRGDFTVQGENK